ncbi:hypothetical protein [Vibrio mediterranei]|uniref:hypothetical protein n=1 Tax=Vibrio mediterranei TaxID=689 RepID=UPI002283F3C4|nr:hypothetical protein [Vibrio mediterranei]MCY9855300.1 hypothetical protein [Vibrio mediterranei]
MRRIIVLIALTASYSHAYEIINLSKEAVNLSKSNMTMSDKEIINYWDDNIESIEPTYFRQIYEGNKKETILKAFNLYQHLSKDNIEEVYSLYESSVVDVLNSYREKVPDYDSAGLKIVIAPGVTWGGQYFKIDHSDYLALGVDLYLSSPEKIKEKLNILITHEIFHHYHSQTRGYAFDYQKYLKDGKLFWQLWDEGMATWGEGFVGDNQNYKYVMFQDYSEYKPCLHDAQLAELFIKEIDNPAIDRENPVNFKKWFGSGSSSLLGSGVPGAYGYYLGWNVINNISKSIPREEFMSWDYQRAKPYIIDQLNNMSSSRICTNGSNIETLH